MNSNNSGNRQKRSLRQRGGGHGTWAVLSFKASIPAEGKGRKEAERRARPCFGPGE